MLKFSVALSRNTASLQNWVSNTASLARAETKDLERGTDLMSIASVEDNALNRLEGILEHALVQSMRGFRKVKNPIHVTRPSPNIQL